MSNIVFLDEREPTGSKDDATILAAWRHGFSDTLDLARRFHTSEANVYHVIASRPRKPTKVTA